MTTDQTCRKTTIPLAFEPTSSKQIRNNICYNYDTVFGNKMATRAYIMKRIH